MVIFANLIRFSAQGEKLRRLLGEKCSAHEQETRRAFARRVCQK
jgi:hypothetical protein